MYARQPPSPRISRPVQIPNNYSGNAFSTKEEPPDIRNEEPELSEDATPPSTDDPKEPEATPVSLAPKLLGGLFGKGNRSQGLGSEELLLLGMILLLSQNDSRDDLLLLLILLLLIG